MEKIDEQIYFLNLPRKIVRSKTERDRFGQMKLLKETTQYRYLSDGSKVSSCDAGGNRYMYYAVFDDKMCIWKYSYHNEYDRLRFVYKFQE